MFAQHFPVIRSRVFSSGLASTTITRKMATIVHDSVPHEDRTASEPRENRIEPVTISHISQINPTTRVLRLSPTDPNHTIKVNHPIPLNIIPIPNLITTPVPPRPMARHLHPHPPQSRRLHHNLSALNRFSKKRRLPRTRRAKFLEPSSQILPSTRSLNPQYTPLNPCRRLVYLPATRPPHPNQVHQPPSPHSRRSGNQPAHLHPQPFNPATRFAAAGRDSLPLWDEDD
jgi:hypothetical protein